MTKRDRLSNSKKDAIMNGLCSNTEWVGNSCGQHGSYVFYKGIRYRMPRYSSNVNKLNGAQENDDNSTKTCILTRTKRRENRISSMTMVEKILGLGEFFFLQFREEDPICIGELQLLWHDKQSDQDLSSSRLYYVPETTPSGRTNLHGQDEVLSVSEKVVMRVSDLVTLLVEPSEWDYGCKVPLLKAENGNTLQFRAPNALQRFGILRHGFSTADIEASRMNLRKSQPDNSQRAEVIVLSLQNYNRYRALLSRLGNIDPGMLKKHFETLTALGLHLSSNDRCRIVFCRDSFDYPQLLEHEFVCEELAAVFKGRPRKKVKKSKCQIKRNEVCAAKELSSSTRRVSARQKSKKRTHYDNYALIDEYKPKRRSRKRTNSNKTIGDNACDASNEKGDAADSKVSLTPPLLVENAGSPKKKKKLNEEQTNKRKDLKLSLLSSKNGNYSINYPKNGNKESPSSSGSITPASECGDKSSTPSSPFSTASSPMDSSFDSSSLLDSRSLIRPDSRILKMVPQEKDDFLRMLYIHMQDNCTPINKIPSLGFKRLDLWAFFQVSQQFGGYKQITEKRLWKHVYDKMGGNPSCTSAATSTRKHYEKLLLPFERYLRLQLDQDKPHENDEPVKSNYELADENSIDKKDETDDVIIVETFSAKQSRDATLDKGLLSPIPRDIHLPSNSTPLLHNHKQVNSRSESTSQYINLEKVAHEIIKAEFFAPNKDNINMDNHTPTLFMRPTVPKKPGSPPPLVASIKKQVAKSPSVKEVEGHRPNNHSQQFAITHTPRCSNAPPPFVPRKSNAYSEKEEATINKEDIKSSIIKPNPNFRKFDINNILFGGCGKNCKPSPLKTEPPSVKIERPSSPKIKNGLSLAQGGSHQSNNDIKCSTSAYSPIVPQRSHHNHKLLHHDEPQNAPSSSPRHEVVSRDASSKYRFHEFNPTKAKLDKNEHVTQHVNLQETHYNEAVQRHRLELNNIATAHHNQEKKMRERSLEEERNRRHVLKDWPSHHTPTSSRANEHFNHRSQPYQHNHIPAGHSTPNRSASRSSDMSQHITTVQANSLHSVQNPHVKTLLASLPANISSLLVPLIPPDCTPEMLSAILTSLSGQPQLPIELNFPGAVSPIRSHDRRLPMQIPNGQHRFMELLPPGYSELAAAHAMAAQQAAAAANPLTRLTAANGLHPSMLPMASMEHQLNQMRNPFHHAASYMSNPPNLQALQGPPMNGLTDDPQSLVQLYQMYMYQMYASQMTSPNKPPMAADPLLFRSPKSRIPEYGWSFRPNTNL